jgi:3-dehydroquinate dehydratase-2
MTTNKKTYSILVANGVNLDLLGQREPGVYGSTSLKSLEDRLRADVPRFEQWFDCHLELTFFQTNHEGELLDKFSQKKWDGVVLNPGAWTHTSLALADRLRALQLRFVETHLSNVAARETFRHHSYCAPHAAGVVSGFGVNSYYAALFGLLNDLQAA